MIDDAPSIEQPEPGPRRALAQEPHEPVADALRRHAVERSGGADPVGEDEKGSVGSVGERARGGESARWHGHVDVRGGLPAQEVPEGAAHEVGGPRRPEDDVKRFEGLAGLGRQRLESESTDDKTRAIRRPRPGPTTHRPGQPATSQSRRARPARASRPRLASVSLASSPKSRTIRLGVEYTAPPR